MTKPDKIEVTLAYGDLITIKPGMFKNQPAKIIEFAKNKMRLILTSSGCSLTINSKEYIKSH